MLGTAFVFSFILSNESWEEISCAYYLNPGVEVSSEYVKLEVINIKIMFRVMRIDDIIYWKDYNIEE